MASALKPRRVGLFSSSTIASAPITAAVSSAGRLQSRPLAPLGTIPDLQTHLHDDSEPELTNHSEGPTKSLKRGREDDVVGEKPAKQARRDLDVEASIQRSRAALQRPLSALRAKLEAEKKSSQQLMRHERRRRAADTPAWLATSAGESELQHRESQGSLVVEPTPIYATARECGYAPAEKKGPSSRTVETVSEGTQVENPAPTRESEKEAEGMTTSSTTSFATVADELALERQKSLNKSAEIQRLIHEDADLKREMISRVRALEKQIEEKNDDLKQAKLDLSGLRSEYSTLQKNTDSEVAKLKTEIEQLKRDKAAADTRADDAEAEVSRLNDRNNYLQMSANNASECERKVRDTNAAISKEREEARQDLDSAKKAQVQACKEFEEAITKGKKYKSMCKALTVALQVAGADVGKAFSRLNEDTDMDSEGDGHNSPRFDWRDFVALPSALLTSSQLAASTSKGTFSEALKNSPGKPQASTFGQPSINSTNTFGQPSINSTSTFGKPSINPFSSILPTPVGSTSKSSAIVQHNQELANGSNNELNEVQRHIRELARKVQANEQQSSALRAYMAKQENGEHAEPPPSESRLTFDSYVDRLVADKMANRMDTSSGEPARVVGSNGDIGMNEAPAAGPHVVTSAYVDFANAKRYGPEGWPMQEDGVAYQKSVSRKNQHALNAENNDGRSNNQKRRNNDNDNPNITPDHQAGYNAGLDKLMGGNDIMSDSKEAAIFKNGGSGNSKRNRDGNNGGKPNRGKGKNSQKSNQQNQANNKKQGGNNGSGNGNNGQGGNPNASMFGINNTSGSLEDDTVAGAYVSESMDENEAMIDSTPEHDELAGVHVSESMDENENMPDLKSESGYDGDAGDDSEGTDDEDAYDYHNLATKGTGVRMEADKGAWLGNHWVETVHASQLEDDSDSESNTPHASNLRNLSRGRSFTAQAHAGATDTRSGLAPQTDLDKLLNALDAIIEESHLAPQLRSAEQAAKARQTNLNASLDATIHNDLAQHRSSRDATRALNDQHRRAGSRPAQTDRRGTQQAVNQQRTQLERNRPRNNSPAFDVSTNNQRRRLSNRTSRNDIAISQQAEGNVLRRARNNTFGQAHNQPRRQTQANNQHQGLTGRPRQASNIRPRQASNHHPRQQPSNQPRLVQSGPNRPGPNLQARQGSNMPANNEYYAAERAVFGRSRESRNSREQGRARR